MKYVQLVLLEPPGGCNKTADHPMCPSGVLGRDRPGGLMSSEVAVRVGAELAGLGFHGFYAFHWFSEPMLSMDWISDVMMGLHGAIKGPRFALWTNGTRLTPATWDFVSRFDYVFLSDYGAGKWDWLRAKSMSIRQPLKIWTPEMVENMMTPARGGKRQCCWRPYTEFIVTREGDAHLCCMTWRPEQRLGNVLSDGVAACVTEYQERRAIVASPRHVLKEGNPCGGCARPELEILGWDSGIHEAAVAHAMAENPA